jgi:hypothetical protein
MKNKNEKYNYLLIIVSLLFASSLMIIGYAKLTGVLALNNKLVKMHNWNVSIINIEEIEKNGSAYSKTLPTNTSLKANFNAVLNNPNDYIKYKVTIKNKGNIDAKLNDIYIIPTINKDDKIIYSVDNILKGDILKQKEETEAIISVKYNDNSTKEENNKSILIIFEYVQNNE